MKQLNRMGSIELKQLKIDKSCGYDEMSPRVVKAISKHK